MRSREYRFVYVVDAYGTTCAPFLANRVVKQLARDEGDNFPLARSIVENDIYVDNALFGADEEEEAKETQKQVVDLMKCGGFHLHKWASNQVSLLENCPEGNNERAIEIPFDKDLQLKVLGLNWDPVSDVFQFKVSCEEILNPTKRKVLSLIAKLYDPFGWLAPVIVVAKMLIQELWTGQTKSTKNLELHGFSDASSRAYGACVYLCLEDDLGMERITLLFAKSKVAPLNPVSIPRLELCGAVLLAKILSFVITLKNLENLPVFCHTDSTVVLAWLSKHPSTWRTFVANRVAQIHELLPDAKWQYVPTRENSADCISRGISPSEILNHSLWWKGPPWLPDKSNKSPQECPLIPSEVNLEQKPINIHVSIRDDCLSELSKKISSWPKLLRVTAYCKRFLSNFITKFSKNKTETPTKSGPLDVEEIYQSREFWIKWLQRILRISGRLKNAPISFDEKHPIILPRHQISYLSASHAHLRSLHGGLQLTLHVLRQNFWIIGARSLVKGIIKACVKCVRERAEIPQQLIRNLPDFRVTPSRPFTHTGIDYAGPFDIRFALGRGIKSQKTYIVLFICCSTRSVHIELVPDYSTDAFLAAFHRFVSRRRKPAHLDSDNAKNFVGADNVLKKSLIKIRKDNDFCERLNNEGISWIMSQRRKCKFNSDLRIKYPGFTKTDDSSIAHCLTCNIDINISNKGASDIEAHIARNKHKRNLQNQCKVVQLDNFVKIGISKCENSARAGEATLAFHTVHHHQSFKSTDCTTNLHKLIYKDSEIAQQMSNARTKTQAIAQILRNAAENGLEREAQTGKDDIYHMYSACLEHLEPWIAPFEELKCFN
ncbi:uncharacterized protein LOC127282143 [Leptopilina boulardi]|uniref:uncharacterized protein LOC127282143 n=1 Tax=Leptopilina boulardi TaxID=63433 RepID=UPI0021F689B9|nr:uncharacterized protein LOC127282143 [Leptopilina boulardi]